MTVLSKLLGPYFTLLPYNCYELAHTWTPHCSTSGYMIFKSSVKESFKIYSTLYILSTLLKRPKLKDIDYVRLFKDIIRSTAFLTLTAVLFITSICFQRRTMGFFILPTFFMCGFIASIISIFIERKTRRGMLALYLTNLASEVAFRMLVHRKIITSIKYGEVLLFSFVMSNYFYLLKTGRLNVYAGGAIKTIFAINDKVTTDTSKFSSLPFRYCPKFVLKLLQTLRRLPIRSQHCPHSFSCLSVGLEGFLQNFVLAFSGTSVLRLLTSLPVLIKRPLSLGNVLFNKKAFGLPLFLGLLPALYHGSSCVLRRLFDRDSPLIHSIAGFVAGLSMYCYPSVSITMYLLWKLIEVFYFKGVENGYFPHFPNSDVLIYSLSTAFVLFAGIMEPQALRPGYWKFLMNLTGTNYAKVNRRMLDVYGFNTSKLFRDFIPQFNKLYLTIHPNLMP